jgi:hypothetical protein
MSIRISLNQQWYVWWGILYHLQSSIQFCNFVCLEVSWYSVCLVSWVVYSIPYSTSSLCESLVPHYTTICVYCYCLVCYGFTGNWFRSAGSSVKILRPSISSVRVLGSQRIEPPVLCALVSGFPCEGEPEAIAGWGSIWVPLRW